LELKVQFESKLILIPTIKWGGLSKINVHKYITYSFSMTIGPHVCDSWNITKQREIKKITQCPFIKSLLFYTLMVFFLKGRYYNALIV
jgi:hypothetical protein